MTAPTMPRTLDHSAVLMLVSTNGELADELARGLDDDGGGDVEIQVVGDLDGLELRLEELRPDAVLVDTDSLPPSLVDSEEGGGQLARAPVVLLSTDAETWRPLRQRLNVVDHIVRREGYVAAVADAIRAARRAAGYESRIQETVAHYRDILAATSDGIFVLVGGVFTFVNHSFASALGYAPEDLIETSDILAVTAPDDRHVLQEELARVAVAGGRREMVDVQLLTVSGETRVFAISCRASTLDGKRAIVGVARDVTADRRLEEEVDRARQRAAQIERLRALGELAAGVAHDFNNVLETVLGRVERIREKLARGDAIDDDLGVIGTAAETGAATVKRVREFSRPTGSDTWHDVDLQSIVEDAAQFIKTRIPKTVRLQLELNETPTIQGNGAELREVLLNLLTNAMDAVVGRGAVTLRSYAERGQAVVEVEDTGCGMEAEVQRRVFEPFFTTKGESGTGLGLSVTHGILRRHDAQILLESEPDRGTRFRLIFSPFEPIHAGSPREVNGVMQIVVVDDDEAVAELMKDLLGELGHTVEVRANVNDTLNYLAEHSVDLLITDLDLDGMSGWHLARTVRQIHPHIVVGLITGWPLGATDEELKGRGVDFVLAKPFSIDALTDALARVRNRQT